MTVDAATLGTVSNQAIDHRRRASGSLAADYLSDGNGGGAGAPPTDVLVEQCAQTQRLQRRHAATASTSVSPRVCVACLADTNCAGTTPVCNTGTHACQRLRRRRRSARRRAPACQASGACGACSATNIGLCGGSTPICDTADRHLRAVPGQQPVRGATPVCNTATKICVGCLANADCGGADADLRSGVPDLPGLRRRQRVRRRHAGLPAGRRLRPVLGGQRDAVHGRDAGLRRRRRHLRPLRRQRRLLGHDAGLRRRHAHLPGLRRRRRVRRRDARLPAVRRLRPVLGDQRHAVQRRDAGLLHDDRDLRAVHVERAVRRRRRRSATRRRTPAAPAPATASAAAPRPPASRRAPAASARRRNATACAGATPVCYTPAGDLRRRASSNAQCGGHDAGLQHDDAHLPRLRRRRRVRRRDAGLPAVAAPAASARRRNATLVQRRDAGLLHGGGDLRALHLERAVRRRRRRSATRPRTPAAPARGDSECGGARPACQPSGACGQCSATNATACARRHARPATRRRRPACRARRTRSAAGRRRSATRRRTPAAACAGDGECGGATPACQPSRRLRPVLGHQRDRLRRRDAGLLRAGRRPACRASSNAQCGGATPVCNTATHTCRACAGDGECGGATPACQPSGACGQCSATNARPAAGATPVCFAAGGHLRRLHVERAVRRRRRRSATRRRTPAAPAPATATAAARRPPASRPAPAASARRPTPRRCTGATPACDVAAGDLRAVHVERAVRRHDAGLQHGDAHLPRLRRRRRVRRRHARLPALGRLRPVLARQHAPRARARRRSATRRPAPASAAWPTPTAPGATPVCDPPSHTCRACTRRQRVRRRHAGLPAGRRLRPVLGRQRARAARARRRSATSAAGTCVACLRQRRLRRRHAGLRRGHAHLPRLRRRRRLRRRDARLPAVGRVRRLLRHQHDAVHRRRCPPATSPTGTCVNCIVERRVRRRRRRSATSPPRLPRLRRRRRVRRRDARLPAVGRLRPVLGDEHAPCARAPKPLCYAPSGTCVACLADADCPAAAPVCDADLPHLPRLRRRRRVRRRDARLPAVGRLRPVLGDQRHRSARARRRSAAPAAGTCVACLSDAQCGGATPVCDADLARLPRLRRRRRLRRRDARLPAVGRLRPVLGHQRARAARGATPGLRRRRRGICVACTSSAQCAGTTPVCDVAHQRLPRLRGRRRLRRRDARLPAVGRLRRVLGRRTPPAAPARRPLCYTPVGICVECLDNADCARRQAGVRSDPRTPAARCARRRRLRRRLPACQPAGACGQCSATQRHPLQRRHAGLRDRRRHLRRLPVERRVRRHDAGLRRAARVCRACASDADCGPATPICLPSGACAACTATDASHCPASAPRCDTSSGVGACVGCLDRRHCGGVTPVCSPGDPHLRRLHRRRRAELPRSGRARPASAPARCAAPAPSARRPTPRCAAA